MAIRSPASMYDRMRLRAAARGTRCRRLWPSTPSARVDERVSAAHTRLQSRKRRLQLRRLCGEPLRSLPGNLDDPGDDHFRRKRREHLRTRRLDLHEAEAGQFLHRQVDLRARDTALAAQRRRVGHAAEHEGHQGLPFVERQSDVFELLGIGQAHALIIYSYE